MLSRERVEEVLSDAGVLLNGHFLLTSGRHSNQYMQCAKILQYPWYATELVGDLTEAFQDDAVDVVLAPAMGGVIIGYELARQLNVKNLFAERENGVMTIRRGFELPAGAKVLVVEDVTTTGGTVFEVIELAKAHGAEVVGVALLVDRSNGLVDFGVKQRAVYAADVQSWEEDNCPLCKEGAGAPVKPGSRKLS